MVGQQVYKVIINLFIERTMFARLLEATCVSVGDQNRPLDLIIFIFFFAEIFLVHFTDLFKPFDNLVHMVLHIRIFQKHYLKYIR